MEDVPMTSADAAIWESLSTMFDLETHASKTNGTFDP